MHAKIHLPSPMAGIHGSIELDGVAQTNVAGIVLKANVREINQLTLELVLPTVDFEGDVYAVIDEQTAAMLVKLGWTPPGPGAEAGRQQRNLTPASESEAA